MIASGPSTGKGSAATSSVAPSRAATNAAALRIALYSWSAARMRSPGWKRSERRTVLTPVVALATKARSSGSAFRNAPTRRRASSWAGSSSSTNQRTGSRSMRSCQARWAARTSVGQAPNEPWLRKVMAGSSGQWSANGERRAIVELCHHRAMCGRFTQQRPTAELAEMFDAEPLVEASEPRFNVAPSQGIVAVVRPPEDRRLLTTLRWGLIPSWAEDPKVGYKMINARAESVFTSPAFRTSIRKKRCLIPADSFYEWRRQAEGPKQPYLIHRPDGQPLALAGIWSTLEGARERRVAAQLRHRDHHAERAHGPHPRPDAGHPARVGLGSLAGSRRSTTSRSCAGCWCPSWPTSWRRIRSRLMVNNTRNEGADLTAPITGEVLRA